MRRFTQITLWTLVLLLFVGQLYAEVKFKWGARERIRHTYMNNNMDFTDTFTDAEGKTQADDEQGFFRVRTNLWGSAQFTECLSAKLQITNEFRPVTITRASDEGKDFTFDEIFIDNLFLNYKKGIVNLTVGRQNIIYGEGFVMLEGAPWDGSRAIYHDAIKLSLNVKKGTTVDLLGIHNTPYDELFPTVKLYDKEKAYKQLSKDADGNKWMNDGVEDALGVYATHKADGGKQFEGYYFLKMEEPKPWINKGISEAQLEDLTLNTIGGRVTYPVNDKLGVVTEWAYQMGSQSDYNQSSYGGYLNLNYKLMPEKKGTGTLGVYVLSGDDPETADIEGWNPIFSRWPKWSELYIYSTIGPETYGGAGKVAYMSNIIAPNLKYVMDVAPGVNLTLWYHNLSAFYATGPGTGTNRGNEFQCWVKVGLDKYLPGLTGHVLYDYFIPGDFYADGADAAQFLRFELMYTFNSK
jgi:hypothetical protein